MQDRSATRVPGGLDVVAMATAPEVTPVTNATLHRLALGKDRPPGAHCTMEVIVAGKGRGKPGLDDAQVADGIVSATLGDVDGGAFVDHRVAAIKCEMSTGIFV